MRRATEWGSPYSDEIDARHGALGVKQHLGDGLGGLGLAHARGTQEQERADGATAAQARGVAPQDARDASDLRLVTDDPAGQDVLQVEHAVRVGFEQALHRHVRGFCHHLGHGFGSD